MSARPVTPEADALRFDDMLATLLAQPLPHAAARAAAWRQIVDILAQGHGRGDSAIAGRAFDLVRELRDGVPPLVRAETARALSGRRIPMELVALFAEEPASIAAPLIGESILSADEWVSLLPSLSPTVRGLLRHRRDLPREVTIALGSFGASDFVIPPPARPASQEAVAPEIPTFDELLAVETEAAPVIATMPDDPAPLLVDGEAQIQDMLSRIESFRARGRMGGTPVPASADSSVEEFRFETGADGVIIWVEGAPRGAVIGETIAVAARGSHYGVDGHAAGAYRRRAPFRDARLTISASGPAGGEWRISGVPFFQPRDGRFTGYRGTARRPRAGESATPAGIDGGVLGSGMKADSLRQLVHELRTPLNAIVGFSEMIERQYMGPAGAGYRAKASDIIAQGRRLLAAVDDLDMAAKAGAPAEAGEVPIADAASMLARLHEDYLPAAKARSVALRFRIEPGLPMIEADPVTLERMFTRLISATIAIAAPQERITVDLARDGAEALVLTVARPAMLAGRDERTLLDPGYNPEGDWPDAPVLGLGFALRLVRNLASAASGRLEIEEGRFLLVLPIGGAPAAQAGEGNG